MTMNLADARYRLDRLRPQLDDTSGCQMRLAGEHCELAGNSASREVLEIAEDLLEQMEKAAK